MKALVEKNVVVLLLMAMHLILITGNAATSKRISYDYSAKMECLSEPEAPHYNGGLLRNPGFDHGFGEWRAYGQGKTELRLSPTGNKFIVAHGRSRQQDSFSHELNLEKDQRHSFSAWVQVSHGHGGNVMVTAAYKYTDVNNKTAAGHVGSVLARSGCWSLLKGGFTLNSSRAIEIYFESENTDVELWVDNVSLQPFTKDQWRDHQLQSIEKIKKRKVRIHVSNQQGQAISTNISLENIRPAFPLGCVITAPIIDNQAYQNWFVQRFTVTTFGNEMKWYHTEPNRGQENYSDADEMVAFAKNHGVAVRGHNIFWDDPVAIGLEGHFQQPDMAYVRASLDFLGASGMPIWITELDVKGSNQAAYLEEIMREVYSHPAVQGIIVWAEWPPMATGCRFMCLTDDKFKNLPTGDVVDKLIAEWKTKGLRGETDSKGDFELNMFHGEYLLTVSSSGKEIKQKLDVPAGTSEPLTIRITA